MAKKYLGIEIGSHTLKIAVMSGGRAEKLVMEPVPDNLVRDGVIVSWEAMADCVREAIKKNNISAKNVYMALPEKHMYQKRILLPAMTTEQLKVNLPYEFHDYISEDRDQYIYDYVVLEHKKDEDGNIKELDLIGVAVLKEVAEKYIRLCRRAGLKLVALAPEFSAYHRVLLSYAKATGNDINRDFALLNLGHESAHIWFFTGGEYSVTRNMDQGVASLTQTIADIYECDFHIAEVYMYSNHENVMDREEVMDACGRLSVEIMRVLNFFNFNHPENNLDAMYYCGGGAQIQHLIDAVGENLDLPLVPITELMQSSAAGLSEEEMMIGVEAIGIGLAE